jgi:hypothetical protein
MWIALAVLAWWHPVRWLERDSSCMGMASSRHEGSENGQGKQGVDVRELTEMRKDAKV